MGTQMSPVGSGRGDAKRWTGGKRTRHRLVRFRVRFFPATPGGISRIATVL